MVLLITPRKESWSNEVGLNGSIAWCIRPCRSLKREIRASLIKLETMLFVTISLPHPFFSFLFLFCQSTFPISTGGIPFLYLSFPSEESDTHAFLLSSYIAFIYCTATCIPLL